jgi:hypothetical protein
MVGCKIMSRCIAFGSLVVNRYAQSNSITSEQEKSNNDVNSPLIVNSNLVMLHLKSDGELNSKKVEDLHRFPMGIYLPKQLGQCTMGWQPTRETGEVPMAARWWRPGRFRPCRR